MIQDTGRRIQVPVSSDASTPPRIQCAVGPIQVPARRDASPLKLDQHSLAVKQVAVTREASPPAPRQDGSAVNQGGLAGDADAAAYQLPPAADSQPTHQCTPERTLWCDPRPVRREPESPNSLRKAVSRLHARCGGKNERIYKEYDSLRRRMTLPGAGEAPGATIEV
jgi:hypothetical protein